MNHIPTATGEQIVEALEQRRAWTEEGAQAYRDSTVKALLSQPPAPLYVPKKPPRLMVRLRRWCREALSAAVEMLIVGTLAMLVLLACSIVIEGTLTHIGWAVEIARRVAGR
jgi:hypothetical protein